MPALFAAAVTLSAFLLFIVQPMAGKTLLPRYGGSAGVWTASMLFFQIGLLGGYAYAHGLTSKASSRTRVWLHTALLALAVAAAWLTRLQGEGDDRGDPALSILLTLAGSIGLPYLALASSSPLMQFWRSGPEPYRLFAVSNAASLAGLVAYPVIVEPWIPLRLQWTLWAAGFTLFALLSAAIALRSGGGPEPEPETSRLEGREPLLWLALAAAPCALWLSVAHHMSQNIAPLPLLWVLPLSLYLLSFVLAFESSRWYCRPHFRILLPLAFLCLMMGLRFRGWSRGITLPLALMSVGLFLCCLFCHGELASRRPPARKLTGFYLMVALGGALGGLFVSVVAPLVFSDFWEFPVATIGVFLLALACVYGATSWKAQLRLAAVGLLALALAARHENAGALKMRNFYGVLEVREGGQGPNAWRGMLHGGILHGMEFRDPARRHLAASYYGAQTGIGMEMRRPSAAPRRIGVVGLGAGVMAAHTRTADHIRFYEINPQVVDAATQLFGFLGRAKGPVEIVLGDARISLSREQPQNFDILVVDAFSGDAIPMHLITREAFEIYLRHLKPDGVLAVHVTNRYLRLYPHVIAIAESLGRKAAVIRNEAAPEESVEAAIWVIVRGRREPAAAPAWTDQYSNLIAALR